MEMEYLIPYNVYVFLKWFGLIACPAIATFIGVVGTAWGYDLTPVVTTITAVGVLVGVLLKYSESTAEEIFPENENNS